jgi:hypothetical protein
MTAPGSAGPPFWYVLYIRSHSLTAAGIEEPTRRHPARCLAKLWDCVNGPGTLAKTSIIAVTFTVYQGNID